MISGENGSGFNFPAGLFQSPGGNSGVERIKNGKRKINSRLTMIVQVRDERGWDKTVVMHRVRNGLIWTCVQERVDRIFRLVRCLL